MRLNIIKDFYIQQQPGGWLCQGAARNFDKMPLYGRDQSYQVQLPNVKFRFSFDKSKYHY
jgi:hypothetical protein